MEQSSKLLKIGDLAKRAGVTVRTVRYYEELGLLTPTETSPGGFRLYSENDLRKLHFIKRFKNLDFPLEEILELIDVSKGHGSKSEIIQGSLALLQRQLEQVDNKMAKLAGIKKEIKEAISLLHECNNCTKEQCLNGCPNREALI